MKNKGPNMEPRGTPHLIICSEELVSLRGDLDELGAIEK